MITDINIKNFKSIVDLTIPLSNINVFIGENGCGKTNILEAVGFASAATRFSIDTSILHLKGVRNAKPSLIFNSFSSKEPNRILHVEFNFLDKLNLSYTIYVTSRDNEDEVFPSWNVTIGGNDSAILGNEPIEKYLIFTPSTLALRGITNESPSQPMGIYGENLDVLISTFNRDELSELAESSKFISWLDEFMIDQNDELKFKGYKPGRGKSLLYFKDKYMKEQNNIFSAENANEGILHVLFYLTLLISKRTPQFFAVDNIENGLNPKLCRNLMKKVAELAIEKNKQALITTHNPAVLDGLNLHDDRQRLFVVKRNDEGHTKIERIKLKPNTNGEQLKLSEMWMRGYLGGLPTNF